MEFEEEKRLRMSVTCFDQMKALLRKKRPSKEKVPELRTFLLAQDGSVEFQEQLDVLKDFPRIRFQFIRDGAEIYVDMDSEMWMTANKVRRALYELTPTGRAATAIRIRAMMTRIKEQQEEKRSTAVFSKMFDDLRV